MNLMNATPMAQVRCPFVSPETERPMPLGRLLEDLEYVFLDLVANPRVALDDDG